jgi:hypothetical protein
LAGEGMAMKAKALAVLSIVVVFLAASFGAAAGELETDLKKAEAATDAGLQWLAKAQEADGHWDSAKHGAKAPDDIAVTAVALLAFLDPGHSAKDGKYADTVRRAGEWLVAQQKPDGGIRKDAAGKTGPAHALAGQALAELYGTTRNQATGAAAQKAADYSVKTYQVPYSGWGNEPGKDANLAATLWFVMQLKSAKIAGNKVDGAGFQGAMVLLDKVSDRQGRCGPEPGMANTPTMTAAGMICRQFMGTPSRDPAVRGAADYLLVSLPAWEPPKEEAKGGNAWASDGMSVTYFWYGSLAMFCVGDKHWREWSAKLLPLMLEKQTQEGEAKGSWEPLGPPDRLCGRVWATAMGTQVLEAQGWLSHLVLPLPGPAE